MVWKIIRVVNQTMVLSLTGRHLINTIYIIQGAMQCHCLKQPQIQMKVSTRSKMLLQQQQRQHIQETLLEGALI